MEPIDGANLIPDSRKFQNDDHNLKIDQIETSLEKKSRHKTDSEIQELFKEEKTSFRRLENLEELFKNYHRLTRKEIVKITGLAKSTVSKDLKQLITKNFIKRIKPSSSPRSHYFQLLQ